MKTLGIFYLIFIVFAFSFCSQKGDNEEYSDLVEGYIVGSFVCHQTDNETGQATGDTERGYCILTGNNINTETYKQIDFYTFNLPAGLLNIPEELISGRSDSDDCGPCFFPDDQRTNFKIKFRYREITAKEKIKFVCGHCNAMYPGFLWEKYDEVSLKDVTNINPKN